MREIIKHEEWNELNKVLAKLQIGYTVSYDAHGESIIVKIVQIDPFEVHYFEEKDGE